MILAAGRGTRLGALGRSTPKVLVDVGGRPLLQRHLEYLEREGFSRVVLNAHHLAAQITAFVASYAGPLEICCVLEARALGTAGGVRNALPLLEPGPFLVLYGDVLVEEPLAPLFELHQENGAVATLVVHWDGSAKGKGVVRADVNGRVTGFEEKSQSSGRALVNSGVYVVEPELVSSVPAGTPTDFGHHVFPSALDRGLPIFSYPISDPVIDIGTPRGLALAHAAVGVAP
ncbi:MAG: nucleotidyltransferase family protein [Actinomycetota bacterium]|nr:nucleotidyltransferase family protein [Actinomycetota bacterium]